MTEAGFFQAGGTLKPGTPSYVARAADRELYESLLAGDYCYVLTPRQMGKSSLMTRTAARLREEGHQVAVVDLTGIGGHAQSLTADQWYYGLAHRLLRELKITFPLSDWWKEQVLLPPLQRLLNFFEEGILTPTEGRIFIFIDEIDTTIRLSFSDDFFAAIRACFNARANDSRFARLGFVMLGVASPADLIRDPTRTPFNIGRRIDLTDFSDAEAAALSHGLSADEDAARRLLARILYWTGGHPYLTQWCCAQLRSETAADHGLDARVDRLISEVFFGVASRSKEDNLKFVHERIAQADERPQILKTYAKVLAGRAVGDQPQSPVHAALKLSGLVKTAADGTLVVRNRIYRQVFNRRWIRSLNPSRWPKRTAIAALLLIAVSFGWWVGARQLTVRSGISIVLAKLGLVYPEPDMVDIPEGYFTMGSPEDEAGRTEHEGPQRRVYVNRFALSRGEISFDEFDAFAFLIKNDGGCPNGHEVPRPADEGWGRGRRPAINVSWEDATCYVDWLSRKTGKHYRLPTEAEWEYAARGGTVTARPWSGDEAAACAYANVLDRKHEREVKDFWLSKIGPANPDDPEFMKLKAKIEAFAFFACDDDFAFTAPVGSFPPNPFGLNDMLGNVWEWTQDCWHIRYVDAPDDSRAWLDGEGAACAWRVIRGGAWDFDPTGVRSAHRRRGETVYRSFDLGIRVARDP